MTIDYQWPMMRATGHVLDAGHKEVMTKFDVVGRTIRLNGLSRGPATMEV